jgi:hypothetical protein
MTLNLVLQSGLMILLWDLPWAQGWDWRLGERSATGSA